MDPLPTPDELADLFGGDPTDPYGATDGQSGLVYWPYTRLVFSRVSGSRAVAFDLEPGYEQVRITLADHNSTALDLLVRQVAGLAIERAKGRELLRIDLHDGFRGGSLWLQLAPELSVGWEVGEI